MGRHGWGDVSKQDFIMSINEALDLGVNFFDTADIYGLGESEETLGEALKGKRNRAIIATKFGVRVENGKTFYDNSPEWINQTIENSLKRLQSDYIDLYQVHYRDGTTPIYDVIQTLEGLKERGLIRHYGLSNIHEEDSKELANYQGKFVSFQDEYSLANRKNERDMLFLSEQFNMTPLTWGSLGQGILTGKYDINSRFNGNDRRSRKEYINFHGENLINNLKIVGEMKKISKETGRSVASIAIRWILDYIPQSVVITGIKNSKQLKSNASALNWNLDEKYIQLLEQVSNREGYKVEQ